MHEKERASGRVPVGIKHCQHSCQEESEHALISAFIEHQLHASTTYATLSQESLKQLEQLLSSFEYGDWSISQRLEWEWKPSCASQSWSSQSKLS